MQTLKRGLVATALLFSPLVQAEVQDQLTAFFAQQLAGFSDEVNVTVRTPPNLYPSCEQPSFSVTGTTKLWGNVNVLARCPGEKRYLQVAVQATGNYVVAAVPIARGSMLHASSVTLKRGRLDQLPPRTMLDINQAQDAVSLRDVAPGQPIQLSMLRQAWRGGRYFLATVGKMLAEQPPLHRHKHIITPPAIVANDPLTVPLVDVPQANDALLDNEDLA